jgi:nucleotide-binding universal stress UspA family protein
MVSKILAPTDGSKSAKKAVKYAVDLAAQAGAEITFVSVIDRSMFVVQTVPAVVSPTHLNEPIEDYLRQAAEAYIDEAEKLCKNKRVKSKRVIRTGHPVEEIIREAEKSKVDLIVMGSHGRTALKTTVIGSVASGILMKEGKIPVLVTKR